LLILPSGIVSAVLTMVVLIYVFAKRENIGAMTGMMIAMSLGMIVGLNGGMLASGLFNDNFFYRP